jgi:hypothetical protein
MAHSCRYYRTHHVLSVGHPITAMDKQIAVRGWAGVG